MCFLTDDTKTKTVFGVCSFFLDNQMFLDDLRCQRRWVSLLGIQAPPFFVTFQILPVIKHGVLENSRK